MNQEQNNVSLKNGSNKKLLIFVLFLIVLLAILFLWKFRSPLKGALFSQSIELHNASTTIADSVGVFTPGEFYIATTTTAGEISCALNSNNYIYCPVLVGQSLFLMQSINGGKIWKSELVPNAQPLPYSTSKIAIDSRNAVYVFWEEDGGIYYQSKTPEHWSSSIRLSDGLGIQPAIAIDGGDVIHAVWFGKENKDGGLSYRDLLYRTLSDNTMSEIQTVASKVDFPDRGAALAVDYQNRIHIVWPQSYGIKYRTIENNTLSIIEDIDTRESKNAVIPAFIVEFLVLGDANPSIAIGSDNAVNVAWESHSIEEGKQAPTKDTIVYQKKAANGWLDKPIEVVVGSDNNQECPAITVDKSNNVYLAWKSDHIYAQQEGIATSSDSGFYAEANPKILGANQLKLALPVENGTPFFVEYRLMTKVHNNNAKLIVTDKF